MKPSRIQGTFPLTLAIIVILAGALAISLLFFSFWQKLNKNVEVILKDQFNQQHRIILASGTQDKQVWFSIQDTGKGMKPEVREKAFHPVFTAKEKDTGLGLAVIHKIITDHEGIVELESAPGVGTTFTIRLPVEG